MSLPTALNGGFTLLLGNCLERLRDLPAESVHTCVTSPPYFGLRDYGQDGQIGLEPTPDEFVEALVRVFREVRRVLRDDGTVWLNLGDSYASGGRTWRAPNKNGMRSGANADRVDHRPADPEGVKQKDLLGIPWMVAFALRADGWYLRQDIIWHKPNPMPESVRDRCTKAHEYVFLLSKGPRYFYDHEAAKEPATSGDTRKPHGRGQSSVGGRTASGARGGPQKNEGGLLLRNRRSVWTVATKPYKGAHFATFPPDLIEPCILAGSPKGGTVLDPFGGSGTTAGVALAHGRRAVLCELSPEYAELVPDRIGDILARYGKQPQSVRVPTDREADALIGGGFSDPEVAALIG